MDVREAIKRLLAADAGVSALVSNRIYPGTLPQSASYPAITYRVVRRTDPIKLNPSATSKIAVYGMRFFVAIKSTSPAQAIAVSNAIAQCLTGYKDTVTDGESPADTCYIDGIFPITGFDFYDDPTQTHQVMSEFDVWAETPEPNN